MSDTTIRFRSFPQTEAPPALAAQLAEVFRAHELQVATTHLTKGLTSDAVLHHLAVDLAALGFDVETGKRQDDKILRPVFFGENGVPTLQYEVDAYHSEWRCGLEVEAGRAWKGNAIYRDLIQGMVMSQVDILALAVPNQYRYKNKGRDSISPDYDNACKVAEALFGHSRFTMPYKLIVIGY